MEMNSGGNMMKTVFDDVKKPNYGDMGVFLLFLHNILLIV